MDSKLPEAEVRIDDSLVRALLVEQHPDLADETLALVDTGWDNVTYKVGAQLAVRMPRREAAVQLLRNEQTWLPVLGPKLGIRVPTPVRLGVPSRRFPWPWSVVEWIPGATADMEPLAVDEAGRLASILSALHQPAPPEAPTNPFRGVPLRARSEFVEQRLSCLVDLPTLAVERLRGVWKEGLAAPEAGDGVWLHGDLHPRNVLVEGGRLAGLIDWGDLASGDRATDLACAWMLLSTERARASFWDEYGAPPPDVARAKAWAVFFGSALSDSGEARHERVGRRILRNLLSASS